MTSKPSLTVILFLMLGAPLYADGGTQISACIAALPSMGGVCDFRNYGALTAASTIVVNKPTTLLLDGTQLTLNGSPGILIAANGVRIEGAAGQTKLIQGGTLGSTPYNRNVIDGNTLEDLKIEGITFMGIPCSVPQDNNSGIHLSNPSPENISRVRVTGSTFTGFCLHGVMIQNASDVVIEDNVIYGVSYGIRFSGVTRGKIINNVVRDTQIANNGAFTVAIGLDTTAPLDDGLTYPISTDIQIAKNTVFDYVNGEAVMVHSGCDILISDNVFNNVLMGIGVNPFNSTDYLYDVTVTGNAYVGTTTSGASRTTGNYGIFVGGGGSAAIPSNIIVTNNTVSRANEIARSGYQGGIRISEATNVLVQGNFVHDTFNTGILQTSLGSGVVIRENYVHNIPGGD